MQPTCHSYSIHSHSTRSAKTTPCEPLVATIQRLWPEVMKNGEGLSRQASGKAVGNVGMCSNWHKGTGTLGDSVLVQGEANICHGMVNLCAISMAQMTSSHFHQGLSEVGKLRNKTLDHGKQNIAGTPDTLRNGTVSLCKFGHTCYLLRGSTILNTVECVRMDPTLSRGYAERRMKYEHVQTSHVWERKTIRLLVARHQASSLSQPA